MRICNIVKKFMSVIVSIDLIDVCVCVCVCLCLCVWCACQELTEPGSG